MYPTLHVFLISNWIPRLGNGVTEHVILEGFFRRGSTLSTGSSSSRDGCMENDSQRRAHGIFWCPFRLSVRTEQVHTDDTKIIMLMVIIYSSSNNEDRIFHATVLYLNSCTGVLSSIFGFRTTNVVSRPSKTFTLQKPHRWIALCTMKYHSFFFPLTLAVTVEGKGSRRLPDIDNVQNYEPKTIVSDYVSLKRRIKNSVELLTMWVFEKLTRCW